MRDRKLSSATDEGSARGGCPPTHRMRTPKSLTDPPGGGRQRFGGASSVCESQHRGTCEPFQCGTDTTPDRGAVCKRGRRSSPACPSDAGRPPKRSAGRHPQPALPTAARGAGSLTRMPKDRTHQKVEDTDEARFRPHPNFDSRGLRQLPLPACPPRHHASPAASARANRCRCPLTSQIPAEGGRPGGRAPGRWRLRGSRPAGPGPSPRQLAETPRKGG